MASNREQRFRMRSDINDALNGSDWTWDRTNILLTEFDLPPLTDDPFGPDLVDVIRELDENRLTEMHGIVCPATSGGSTAAQAPDLMGLWEPGYVRSFISHTAIHKSMITDVASELRTFGIHGFVAHETMQVSKPWQEQLEAALRSMDTLVVILHPEVNDSAWCQQEIGWALGRNVPVHVLRCGTDPAGFISRDQWASITGSSAKDVAELITKWTLLLPAHQPTIVDALVTALRSAHSFDNAAEIAAHLEDAGSLSSAALDAIRDVWVTNSQLHGRNPTEVLERIFTTTGRAWPPTEQSDPVDAGGDFEPF